MRQFNLFANTRGFISTWERVVRFRYMITEQAKERVKILAFWEKHGLEAASDAYGVSRATLYRWAAALREGNGQLESLNARSRAPYKRRTRNVDAQVSDFIIKTRSHHPRLGKEKLAELLSSACRSWGIAAPSSSTVGRILSDLKKRGALHDRRNLSFSAHTGHFYEKTKKKRKKLRRKGYVPSAAGGLVQLDSIVKFINGLRRYLVTATDTTSRFSFAYAYPSLSSQSAADFMAKLRTVAPFAITHIQTDNGSEFEKTFRDYAAAHRVTHFHNYPKSPKMNACVERFNRTVQEEFASRHWLTLRDDVPSFNQKLIDWLLWYNTGRPHWSLGFKTPMHHIISRLPAEESHMLWTDTHI